MAVPRLTLAAPRRLVGIVTVAAVGFAGAAWAAPASFDPAARVTATGVNAQRRVAPGPTLGGCRMFPVDNAWNVPVDTVRLLPNSAAMISTIQSVGGDNLHPDFGETPTYGIPFVVVPQSQPLVPIVYDAYGDESDPGPFPIPLNAPVEAGSDGHVLVLRQGTCELFELFVARRSGAGWTAASGARYLLNSNALRPAGWTSADAAGLPILPGLVRCDEITAGRIDHAIRVTFSQTRRASIPPATHFASSRTDPNLPAMGQRLRLKSSFSTAGYTGQALVLLNAFKRYGLIVADNGSSWYFSGAPGPCWNDDELNQLKSVPGTAFEVVDTGPARS